jgi:hypothetical protein
MAGKYKAKLLVEEIFDPEKGWNYSQNQVPVQKSSARDGNPNFTVNIDGVEILVFQLTEWEDSVVSNVNPMRIVTRTTFPGIDLLDAKALLSGSYDASGLPSFGLNDSGEIVLQAAFPVGPDFPVELARKQLQVCMGLISEDATTLLQSWKAKDAPETDWETVQNVAKVAGVFAKALFF